MGSAKTAIRGILASLIFILLVKTAVAAQPSLPTEFYGEVAYANGNPAVGLDVSAIWSDSSGAKQTSIAKTFTAGEGNSQYAGFYFFNQGRVQAQEGTEIIVSVNGALNSQSVAASPGKTAFSLPLLVIYDPDDKTPPKITGVSSTEKGEGVIITFNTDELTTAEVKYGKSSSDFTVSNHTYTTNHAIEIIDGPSTYLYQVSVKDVAGNGAFDDNNGSNYYFAIKPKTETIAPKAQTNSTKLQDVKLPPTVIFGKLEDEEGNLITDAKVQAEWIDENGIVNKIQTETLNSTEAEAFGNPNLKGYYIFRENISLPAGTKVRITSNRVIPATAVANPGGSSKVDIKVQGRGSRINFDTLIWAGAAVLSVSLGIIGLWRATKKGNPDEKLNKAAKKFLGKKAKEIMSKKIQTVQADTTLIDLAHILMEKEKGGVVVLDNQAPIGFVNEKTITEDILIKGLQSSDEIGAASMLKLVIMSPDTTIAEICSELVAANQKKGIVMSGKKIVGIVTVTDLAEELKVFCEDNRQLLVLLPEMNTVVRRNVVKVKKNATLREVRLALSKNYTDCAIVDGETEAILTERDLIKEIRKNIKKAKDTEASIIAESPIKTLHWTATILDANKQMLKLGFKRLPITNQYEKVYGIVRMEDVVSRLFYYLQNLTSGNRK